MNTLFHPLDVKAVALAKEYLAKEAEILVVLMEMKRQKLFDLLGFTGAYDYCLRRLNLSESQSFYFKSVAEKSEQVPELKAAVVSGELTLSQARRIVPAVTKQNCAVWIGKVQTLTQKELEREVADINPRSRIHEKIKPIAKELSELRVAVNLQTETNLTRLKEILSQKMQRTATLENVIAWAAETTLEKFDPIRKAKRAHAKSAKAIKAQPAARPKNTPPTRRPAGIAPPIPVEPAVTARRNLFLRKPGRNLIPAGLKHAVVLRDQAQCTHVNEVGIRCPQTRWLDCHHVLEVNRGGLNTLENLRLLCGRHHAEVHSFSRSLTPPFP